jgi:hypothetical protein
MWDMLSFTGSITWAATSWKPPHTYDSATLPGDLQDGIEPAESWLDRRD